MAAAVYAIGNAQRCTLLIPEGRSYTSIKLQPRETNDKKFTFSPAIKEVRRLFQQ
jgi:hypothetical protein